MTDTYKGLKKQLTDGGYTITTDSTGSAAGASYGSLGATKGSIEVTAQIAASSTNSGKATVIMSVTPKN